MFVFRAWDHEERTGKITGICYFTYLRQTRGNKNIPKIALKTKLKIKEIMYTLVLEKYLDVKMPFWSIYSFF
jgi:hypothetical protein